MSSNERTGTNNEFISTLTRGKGHFIYQFNVLRTYYVLI